MNFHQLHPATLDDLDVDVPRYDRDAVTPSVVHFGVGGFHRSHQAFYLDRILEAGDLSWGVCGVGVLEADAAVRDAAAAQAGLYTLVSADPDGSESARVIGSIVRYLYAPDDPELVLEQLANESTRIVSLTITEGGYGVNDVSGEFEPTDPATLADMQGGQPPRSVLGLLTEGLRRRRSNGAPPFVVVSCDNIQGNGGVARTALTSFARQLDASLADWIHETVPFPSSMVDRITPMPTKETRALVRERFGVDDLWPVRAESYIQWVLEDDFPWGRPDLGRVGVQLVADVQPYEVMKLRLLNASHQAMGYLGLLAGFTWVHDACQDEDIVAFLRHYMTREAMPTLPEVPGIDLPAYVEQLLQRFGSEAVGDTLARQVVDASERLPKFLLPVLREQLEAEGSIAACALVLAAWSVYLEEHLGDGSPELPDHRATELLEAVAGESQSPGALLDLATVFGDMGGHPRLRRDYLHFRNRLRTGGVRDAMQEVITPL